MTDFTDVDVGEIDVGMQVEMRFRIKSLDRQRGSAEVFLESGAGSRRLNPSSTRGHCEMAQGIKDKVAILGMGCSKFGERWDAGAEELIVEAFDEALGDAGIDTQRDRRGLAVHGDGFRQRRAQRPAAERFAAPAEHRRDPR